MDFTAQEYLAILRDELPEDFLKALLTSLVTAHRSSIRQIKKDWDTAESRKNIIGHVRREKVHEEGLALGEKFKKRGILAAMKSYGTGYYLLFSTKRLFLIVCVTRSRYSMVREAAYRKMLARLNENPQIKFPFARHSGDQPEDGQHLCVLIHARRKGKDYPAFADIAFPHKSFSHWMCRLNLFQEFPDVFNKLVLSHDPEAGPRRKRPSQGQQERSA